MPRRTTIPTGVAGAVEYEEPSLGGEIAAATVQVYDEDGEITSIDGDAATVTGRTLSIAIPAELVDEEGLYRARFTYTLGGVTKVRDRPFLVVPEVATPVLTQKRLTDVYWPRLRPLVKKGDLGGMTAPQAIQNAWEWLEDYVSDFVTSKVRERGTRAESRGIHAIIDAGSVLERAHAAMAAHILAENATVGGPDDSPWQAWGDERRTDATDEVERVLNSGAWMNFDDDIDSPGDTVEAGETRIQI